MNRAMWHATSENRNLKTVVVVDRSAIKTLDRGTIHDDVFVAVYGGRPLGHSGLCFADSRAAFALALPLTVRPLRGLDRV